MKIGIIGAMEQEVTELRQQLTDRTTWQRAGCEIYTGQLEQMEVVLLKSGIGKVAASIGTTLLIEHFQPDYIINTGSAGALSHHLQVGDIVISQQVRYHDVDLTAFGYQLGQMAASPVAFHADPFLIELTQAAVAQQQRTAECGLIVSGDSFINGKQALATITQHFPQAIAVEMEAAAIAHVCHQFATPFVVIRAISDNADQNSALSFDQFLVSAAKSSCQMVNILLRQLAAQRNAG